jgi:murein DD-endopeptidase MepM/ murein hydrolase activator NlpD
MRRRQRTGRIILAVLVGLGTGAAAVVGERWADRLQTRTGAAPPASDAASQARDREAPSLAAGTGGTTDRDGPFPGAVSRSRASNPGAALKPFALAPTADEAIDELRHRDLLVPVDNVAPSQLQPSFTQARGQGEHEALDILAPRGTPVRAVEDGTIEKLFESVRGGLTVYQFDPTRRYAYYYAHLDRYAQDVREGQAVSRGSILGYVGTTGNASRETPHLHFAIFVLTPEKRWWQGMPVDPFLVLREPAG